MRGAGYVSQVPRPLDGLIDDLYYLEVLYALLTLPPAPAALLIVNLKGAVPHPRQQRHRDGRVRRRPAWCTMPQQAEFGYPLRTRSVGVHFKAWGLAPFLPMPRLAELCDRPVTVEQVWGRRHC